MNQTNKNNELQVIEHYQTKLIPTLKKSIVNVDVVSQHFHTKCNFG